MGMAEHLKEEDKNDEGADINAEGPRKMYCGQQIENQ